MKWFIKLQEKNTFDKIPELIKEEQFQMNIDHSISSIKQYTYNHEQNIYSIEIEERYINEKLEFIFLI